MNIDMMDTVLQIDKMDKKYLEDEFFERVSQLKTFYQRLISDDEDAEIVEGASEDIQALNIELDALVKEESKGIDLSKRRLFLYTKMQDLHELYFCAARDNELDFSTSDLEDLARDLSK